MRGDVMYYNKEIEVYRKSKIRDENGVSRETYSNVETVKCDVQSIGKASKKQEYGYTTENIKSVYCDYNDTIKIGNIIVYCKKTFRIDQILWGEDGDEEFIHFIAVEKKVDLNVGT